MVSFIIIGKNEGINLTKCFDSINNVCLTCPSLKYEIVFVDSNSTDNSIEIAGRFATRIIALSGECSPAIGRNTGAEQSHGDNLIFMDGDMEIQTNFFQLVVDSNGNLNYPYVSGDILDIYYDSNLNYVNEGYYYRFKLQNDRYLPVTGGFFCIQKKIWLSVGGMCEKYRICEDLDFGIRLAKKGVLILRKKELAVKHNTISYFEKKRMKKILIKNDFGYRAMLYRDHFSNKNIYKMLFRTDYSFLLLFFVILSLFFFGGHFELTFFYLFVIVIRALFQSSSDKNGRFHKLIFLIIKDIQMFFSFFFFFPKKKKSFSIEILN